MNLLLKIALMVTFLWGVDSNFGTLPDTCLDSHNKDSPSTNTEDHPECADWQDLSCCHQNTTALIHQHGTSFLRTMTAICKQPYSSECAKYQTAVVCWFACEPTLANFRYESDTDRGLDVPICGDYCDAWFDACKDELTCVDDWQTAFQRPGGRNCPEDGSTCITFTQMYGNGQGLCNTMFSTSLRYEASNKDCMVMQFDGGDNPNVHGDPYGKKTNSANTLTVSLVTYLLGLLLISHLL